MANAKETMTFALEIEEVQVPEIGETFTIKTERGKIEINVKNYIAKAKLTDIKALMKVAKANSTDSERKGLIERLEETKAEWVASFEDKSHKYVREFEPRTQKQLEKLQAKIDKVIVYLQNESWINDGADVVTDTENAVDEFNFEGCEDFVVTEYAFEVAVNAEIKAASIFFAEISMLENLPSIDDSMLDRDIFYLIELFKELDISYREKSALVYCHFYATEFIKANIKKNWITPCGSGFTMLYTNIPALGKMIFDALKSKIDAYFSAEKTTVDEFNFEGWQDCVVTKETFEVAVHAEIKAASVAKSVETFNLDIQESVDTETSAENASTDNNKSSVASEVVKIDLGQKVMEVQENDTS